MVNILLLETKKDEPKPVKVEKSGKENTTAEGNMTDESVRKKWRKAGTKFDKIKIGTNKLVLKLILIIIMCNAALLVSSTVTKFRNFVLVASLPDCQVA